MPYLYNSYKATPAEGGWKVEGITAHGKRDQLAHRRTKSAAEELTRNLTQTRAQLLEMVTRHAATITA